MLDRLKNRTLEDGLEDEIIREFGVRGKNAIALVRSGRVKKYRDFFVVGGRKGEYVVEGDFCTCRDYLYRLSKQGGICYHSLATKIAAATGEYQTVDAWYSDIILQREYGGDPGGKR